MWHDMFAQELPAAEKIIRTVVIYALIAVLLRISGKRGLSGLNSLDFVVIFLLSNVVQNAVIGQDNSVTGAAIGAATLVAVNMAVTRAALRSDLFARIFEGSETTVIRDGSVDKRAVRRIGLRRHELDRAVRLQNGEDIDDVADGLFDPDGHLVLTLKVPARDATQADVARLEAKLDRIEAALGSRAG